MTIDAGTQWVAIVSVAVVLSIALRLLSGWIERRERDRTRAALAMTKRANAKQEAQSET
jgi:hypothetical protein